MKSIKDIATEIRVESYLNYRDFLRDLYVGMKKERKPYSYNQFSQDLHLGFTNVSWLVITGRRRLTEHTLAKILKALDMHKLEARCLSYLVRYTNARNPEDKERFFRLLMRTKHQMTESEATKTELAYLSEWFHPVIREMTNLREFFSDARWIMARLYTKLLPREVKESLKLLEELKLVKYSHNKQRHIPSEQQLGPRAEALKIGVEGFHKKMLEISEEALTKVPSFRREYNALSISINEQDVPRLKQMIHEFCGDIMQLDQESKDPDQVYQVNIQMFPFTKV